MNRSIAWKLILTALVLTWAVLAMVPFKDTPFEDYIKDAATAKQTEFAALIETVEGTVDSLNHKEAEDKYPTLYIALREYSNKNDIDLATFFPNINVSDIKVLEKRNTILLSELYSRSKSAIKQGLDLQGGVSFTLQVNTEELSEDEMSKASQLEDVLTVMNNRINGLGVTEPTIRLLGGDALEVQMPGVSLKDNPEAIEELSKPAKLEFRLAHRYEKPYSTRPAPSEIPVGYELMLMEETAGSQIYEKPYFIKKRPEALGDIIAEAGVGIEGLNQYIVSMDFTSEGAKTINKITTQILEEDRRTGTKQLLAIVLDGKLISAPQINSALNHSGQISGNFTQREAIELANALNNPLAVGLERTSLNEVGPSLAEDAKDASLLAAAVAAGLIIAFMIGYYLKFGVVAVFTIFVNITILVGVLASFQATMTLPGIAALALTMGMAVDANILIFERMREELNMGKNLLTALQSGYSMAFSTIVDANVTTLITAIILWYFGTGPVKGFGLTLAVGIVTTMFCALVLSRALLEMFVRTGLFKKGFRFALLKGESNFQFLNWAKATACLSIVVFLSSVAYIFYQGDKCVGIDFTGGENISLSYEEKLPINDILEVASESDLGEVQVSYQTDIASGAEHLALQTETDKGASVVEALNAKFPTAKLNIESTESIGSAVSKDIAKDALIACGLSLLGILIYVAFRFEFGYGVGALVSTFHDVVITIGLYVILGKLFGIGSGQFSSPMVAAILMIVGYSINDTIVVFDRIREELSLKPDATLRELIHIATNKTLARTILTSTSTLLAAIALFYFGTGIIKDFSLVFIIGILVGTFSSLFVATPIFYWWHRGSRKRVEDTEAPAVKYSWEE